jgi:hypothetical protein
MAVAALVHGKVNPEHLAPEIRRGLAQLVQASDYSRALACDAWDFAVELDQLIDLGMTTSDLRWLTKCGYVSHACEMTGSHDLNRRFRSPEQNLAFAQNTCFVLTDAGLAMMGRDRGAVRDASLPVAVPISFLAETGDRTAIPHWNKDTRTFLVGDSLVKRFRVPSPNQEAVLEAFQEEGWPMTIDDPLPPVPEQQPKRRLRDTIKCLNLNQARRLIRFRGDGTGQRVFWELVSESISQADVLTGQPARRAA